MRLRSQLIAVTTTFLVSIAACPANAALIAWSTVGFIVGNGQILGVSITESNNPGSDANTWRYMEATNTEFTGPGVSDEGAPAQAELPYYVRAISGVGNPYGCIPGQYSVWGYHRAELRDDQTWEEVGSGVSYSVVQISSCP